MIFTYLTLKEGNIMSKLTFLIIVSIISVFSANAQETPIIELMYDAAGNRVSKQQVMVIQKQGESEPIQLPTFTKSQCSVKPNPIKERAIVSVQSDIADAMVTFTLYDIKGTILFITKGMVGENDLDMAELTNGVYFLRVYIDGEQADLKIIKQE